MTKNATVFAVGDDDQTIYRFQGAETANMRNFLDSFENVNKITLFENYRSVDGIVAAANELAAKNKLRVGRDHDLRAQKTGKRPVSFGFEDFGDEKDFVAGKICELVKNGVKSENIVILARTNAELVEFAAVLASKNIAVNLPAHRNALKNSFVREIFAILRAVADPRDDAALARAFLTRSLHLPLTELWETVRGRGVAGKAEKRDEDLFSTAEGGDLTKKAMEKLSALHKKLAAGSAEVPELILEVAKNFGIWGEIVKNGDFEAVRAISAVVKNAESEEKHSQVLKDFFEEIAVREKYNLPISYATSEGSGVNLRTIHGSKGLEWDFVFVVGAGERKLEKKRKMPRLPRIFEQNSPYCHAGLDPVSRSGAETFEILNQVQDDKAEDDLDEITPMDIGASPEVARKMEDLRRLFFVAMTRARSECVFSHTGAGSVFLEEAGVEQITNLEILNDKCDKTDKNEQKIVEKIKELEFLHTDGDRDFLKRRVGDWTWSASSLNAFRRCGRAFFYNYLLGVPIPRNIHLALGVAVHGALENWAKGILAGFRDDKKVILDFRQRIERSGLPRDEMERVKKQGVEQLTEWLSKKETPRVKFVERGFKGEVDGVKIRGRIDRIDEIDGGVTVVDYKSGKSKSDSDLRGGTKAGDDSAWVQLQFYALLLELDGDLTLHGGKLEFLRDFVDRYFGMEELATENIKNELKKADASLKNLDFSHECGECEWCAG